MACSSMLRRFLLGCWLSLALFVSCRTAQLPTAAPYQAHLYAVNTNIAEDPEIVAYIAPFKAELDAKMNEVIGRSAQLLKRIPENGQSLAGNFFADALLVLGRRIDPTIAISIGTKDGIRSDISEGDITVGNIFELMPFENYLTILELSGEDMLSLAKFIAKTNGQPVAGMEITIKNQELVDLIIDDKPFDIENTYKVLTYDYLANGGDRIEGLSSPISRADTDVLVREGLIDYINQLNGEGKKIDANRDGRVQILK